MDERISLGANPSEPDYRDVKDYHTALAVPPPISFTDDLSNIPVTMQNKIGLCTANLCYIIERLYEKKGIQIRLSRRFLYTVTKRFIDGNVTEGTSLRSALKAAYKYGVAPEALVPTDTEMTHEQFISEYNWPQNVWSEALKYRIGGYFSVGLDRDSMASAMSQYGALYARFEVGSKWWLPTWTTCLPLLPSTTIISGHAVIPFSYDNSFPKSHHILRNSWSTLWGNQGNGDYFLSDYSPTEVWAVTLNAIVNDLPKQTDFSYLFSKDMELGDTNEDVKNLQIFLKMKGYFDYPFITGFYGEVTRQAVYNFQLQNVSLNWIEKYLYRGRYCGSKTRTVINLLLRA